MWASERDGSDDPTKIIKMDGQHGLWEYYSNCPIPTVIDAQELLRIINLFTADHECDHHHQANTSVHTKTAPIPLCFIIRHVHNTTIPLPRCAPAHAASPQ